MNKLQKDVPVISIKNFIVIVIHSILWMALYIKYDFTYELLLYLLASTAILGLSIVDWNSYEIPIEFNYFILALGIIRMSLDLGHWYEYIIGMFLVSTIFALIVLATKGRGMGGGDVKLMFTLGLLLGWKKILLVMLLGSVLGSIIHIIIMKVSKKDKMLAFGPYLSMGAYLAMLYGTEIINWYLSFYKKG